MSLLPVARPFGLRPKLLAAGVGCLLGSACVHYHPRPIDASRTEAGFRTRSLKDPGLKRYVEATAPGTAFPPEALELGTLTLVGLYYSPALDVARAKVSLAEAGTLTAGARPNPSASVDPAYSANPPKDASPWILGLVLGLPIETAGKRGLRIAEARHLNEAARLDLAEAGWRVRSRVRAALLDHLVARRELELLGEDEQVRAAAVDLLERRLAVGEVSRPDVDAARTDRASLRLATRSAEGRVAESRASLAAALGVPVSALDGVVFAWPDLERAPDEQALSPGTIQRAGLLNRIDLRRALAEYAAAESALKLEVAKQYPDIRLGPGYTYDQGENKFLLGVSIALPIFDRNQGPIAAAEARRAEAGARFLELQARIIGETEQMLERYRASLAELREADLSLSEIQERRERATRRAVELGQEDRLALAGVKVQGAVAARARLEALRKAQAALGALEDAAERPLGRESPPPEPSLENPREAPSIEASRNGPPGPLTRRPLDRR